MHQLLASMCAVALIEWCIPVTILLFSINYCVNMENMFQKDKF